MNSTEKTIWDKILSVPTDSTEQREFLEETRDVEEHPDGYDGPCLCRLCMSYADV